MAPMDEEEAEEDRLERWSPRRHDADERRSLFGGGRSASASASLAPTATREKLPLEHGESGK